MTQNQDENQSWILRFDIVNTREEKNQEKFYKYQSSTKYCVVSFQNRVNNYLLRNNYRIFMTRKIILLHKLFFL